MVTDIPNMSTKQMQGFESQVLILKSITKMDVSKLLLLTYFYPLMPMCVFGNEYEPLSSFHLQGN